MMPGIFCPITKTSKLKSKSKSRFPVSAQITSVLFLKPFSKQKNPHGKCLSGYLEEAAVLRLKTLLTGMKSISLQRQSFLAPFFQERSFAIPLRALLSGKRTEIPPGSKPGLNAVIINGVIFPKPEAALPLSTTENTAPDLTKTPSVYRFFAQQSALMSSLIWENTISAI